MKLFLAVLVTLGAAAVEASQGPANPVSRVVGLLTGLKAKLEKELDDEQDLYDNYKCWHMSTTVTKEASNAAAEGRIKELKAYIADIDAGKIEFTTERVDLEKQIKNLKEDLQIAKETRKNEHEDFVAAKSEMEMAIKALKKAIETINEATEGSFVQKPQDYAGLLATRHSLQKAVSLSRDLLDNADLLYLERLLNGDVPDVDWKKLNRKATFKMKYKKRSGKILETLNDLQETFETNLKNAEQKEADDVKAYEELKEAKESMLKTTEKAREDMVLEGDARGKSRDESQNEVDALEEQVKADKAFITQVNEAFKVKTKEWEARKEVRKTEILAMSQALAVLASDDAKDQFKASFESQGYLLIQKAHRTSLRNSGRRVKVAARLLNLLGSETGNMQLQKLATMLGNEAINLVIEKIDEIVAAKKEEEGEDLTKKQDCESGLAKYAAEARKDALSMDDATESIARETTKVEELKVQIKDQEEKKKSLEKQLEEMKTIRDRETEDYKVAKLDDEKAVELVEEAIVIMKDWKNAKDASLISQKKMTMIAGAVNELHDAVKPKATSFIQLHAAAKQNPEYAVAAGQAPLPPPSTWETGAEYGGATGEQTGIVSILDMVAGDIKNDIAKAKSEEDEAQAEYEKLKADLEAEVEATEKAITAYKEDKAEREKKIEEEKEARATDKESLDSKVELYNGMKPGCDFLLVNFDVRTKARQTEVDGLQKAKAILQGADFGEA